MSILKLGVTDVAYVDGENPGATTTYQVAKILEDKYDVMGVFYEIHGKQIVEDVAQKYTNLVTDLIEGNSAPLKQKRWMLPKVDSAFRDYLANDEWQQETGNVIKAAAEGKTSRKKKKTYGTARPAFIDTGLYSRSFKAWIER